MMQKHYRLAWFFKDKPKNKYYSNWTKDRKHVQKLVDKNNKAWPDIEHYVDEGEIKNC
jgi:hypothetical protein